MKKVILIIFSIILLSASTCQKEDDNCHYNISIKNNSNFEIIAAIPVENAGGDCTLDGKTVSVEKSYDYRPFNFCIEESMDNNSSLDIYIVNPVQFNSPNTYYDCDSIEINNTVLKHYVLTLDDLKRNNFTVTYP